MKFIRAREYITKEAVSIPLSRAQYFIGKESKTLRGDEIVSLVVVDGCSEIFECIDRDGTPCWFVNAIEYEETIPSTAADEISGILPVLEKICDVLERGLFPCDNW